MRCCCFTGGGWRQPSFGPGISNALVLRDKGAKDPTRPQPAAMAVLTGAVGGCHCAHASLPSRARRSCGAAGLGTGHAWAPASKASHHLCRQGTTAQYRHQATLLKITSISFRDQKVHEEQVITLTDIKNLPFICESRNTHWGPGQIQLQTCFVWP